MSNWKRLFCTYRLYLGSYNRKVFYYVALKQTPNMQPDASKSSNLSSYFFMHPFTSIRWYHHQFRFLLSASKIIGTTKIRRNIPYSDCGERLGDLFMQLRPCCLFKKRRHIQLQRQTFQQKSTFLPFLNLFIKKGKFVYYVEVENRMGNILAGPTIGRNDLSRLKFPFRVQPWEENMTIVIKI